MAIHLDMAKRLLDTVSLYRMAVSKVFDSFPAIGLWLRSHCRTLDGHFSTVNRNLSVSRGCLLELLADCQLCDLFVLFSQLVATRKPDAIFSMDALIKRRFSHKHY